MMKPAAVSWRLTVLVASAACCGVAAAGIGYQRPQTDRPSVVELLDRYERGDHSGVVAELAAVSDIAALARDLQRRGGAWTSLPQATHVTVERRRLVAAVFALELVASHFETDWGVLRSTVEWACELIRKGRPTPAERVWHLAAVALAEGATDEYFLLWMPPFSSPDPVVRQRFASFMHANHAARRFPDEIRFRFAEAFANGLPGLDEPKRDRPPTIGRQEMEAGQAAIRRWKKFVDDPVVGSEALLRIGHIYFCLGNRRAAATHYRAALEASRDPYVRYLAHFFTGRLHEADGRRQDAAAAYRQALAVQPFVQSGTMALAGTLFLDERPSEAYTLLNASFTAKPRPPDPWRLWGYGDYRFWPDLIGKLRAEIHP
jgi:tetratricopeptide (TPR) repeat protein